MRAALDQPSRTSSPSELLRLPRGVRGGTCGADGATDAEPDDAGEEIGVTRPPKPNQTTQDEPEPLPDLDPDGITISDVDPGELNDAAAAGEVAVGRPWTNGPGRPRESDRRQREIGSRGEEAAFEKEKQRVAGLRRRSNCSHLALQRNPFAPHDIESIDQDGQRIFIEVKSTNESDPSQALPNQPFRADTGPQAPKPLLHLPGYLGRHSNASCSPVPGPSPPARRGQGRPQSQ